MTHKSNHEYSRPNYYQSAVIPFRMEKNSIEFLLITAIRSGKWIFPKGIIETKQTAIEAAKQEALEEAGVDGEVLDMLLGEYRYFKWSGTCHVKVFPMHVKKIYSAWPEEKLRQRQWVDYEGALKLLEKSDLKKMIKNFNKKKEAILSRIL